MTADKILQPCCLGKITFHFMFNWQAVLTVAIARETGKLFHFEEMMEGLGAEQGPLDGKSPCLLGWGVPGPSSLLSADTWLPPWFCFTCHRQKQSKQCCITSPFLFLSLWNTFYQKMLSPFSRCLKIVIHSNKRGRKTPVSASKGLLLRFIEYVTWGG